LWRERNNSGIELISVSIPERGRLRLVYRVERKGKVDFLVKWVRPDFEAGKYCIGIDEKDLIWNVTLNCG